MRWFWDLLSPALDWIQVEITTHCNAECVYCPRTVFGESWRPIHARLGLFEKLLPYFRRVEHVHLQGWGEPLLHPHFFDMARMAGQSGARIGTTTNGALIDDETADRIVAAGFSVIGFSLAGTDESQDRIRKGVSLEQVLRGLRAMREAKARANSTFPVVHVAYMWMKSQFQAVERLPQLLEAAGVAQVVVTSLDLPLTRELESESIRAETPRERADLDAFMSEVASEGKRRGIHMVFNVPSTYSEPGICTENVGRAVVVSSLGQVTPCVFANLERPGRPSTGAARCSPIKDLGFGDLNAQSLARIWRSDSYRAFREDHALGKGETWCGKCPKLHM